MDFKDILKQTESAGFIYLGGFRPEKDTGPVQTLVLIGNAGPDMWQQFMASRATPETTLDSWTKKTISALARITGSNALFPFDNPAHPFLSWAEKSGQTFTSPIGLSIHPEFGLWHGYRAALIFDHPLDLPVAQTKISPCDSCLDKPCLTTCPVGAFSPQAYDVPACVTHIKTSDQTDCLELGCRARRACPIGRNFHYTPKQAHFHMSAFVNANG